VLMHFRKKSLRQISLDEPLNQDAKTVRREYGSKDDRLVGSVDRIALSRAIRELPAGYRTIFLLHEIEGYEHQEIAQLLECSVGNSKSQLHKAKLRIRELLGQAREEMQENASPAAPAPRRGVAHRGKVKTMKRPQWQPETAEPVPDDIAELVGLHATPQAMLGTAA